MHRVSQVCAAEVTVGEDHPLGGAGKVPPVKSAPTYSVSSQCSGVVTRHRERHADNTGTAAAESTRRPASRRTPSAFHLVGADEGADAPGEQDSGTGCRRSGAPHRGHGERGGGEQG